MKRIANGWIHSKIRLVETTCVVNSRFDRMHCTMAAYLQLITIERRLSVKTLIFNNVSELNGIVRNVCVQK